MEYYLKPTIVLDEEDVAALKRTMAVLTIVKRHFDDSEEVEDAYDTLDNLLDNCFSEFDVELRLPKDDAPCENK